MLAVTAVVSGLAFVGCDQGDTEGDENLELDTPFVADGGSGAKIEIIVDPTIGVGQEKGFFVSLIDPQGVPLAFVRVFCESEKGIAIIAPSSGGVAFEHTGLDGKMSGRIGGLLPGSHIMECTAPNGYGLRARVTIKVTGDVPQGFEGFPGAAGGNLGGGVIVDLGEDDLDDSSIVNIAFYDAGANESGSSIIDTSSTQCEGADTPSDSSDDEFDLAANVLYRVTIKNLSAEKIFIETVQFTIADAASSQTSVQTVTDEIPAGCSGDLVGQFITTTSGGGQTYAGGGSVIAGFYSVTVVITGTTQNGDSFTITDAAFVDIGPVDNCGVSGTAAPDELNCGGLL